MFHSIESLTAGDLSRKLSGWWSACPATVASALVVFDTDRKKPLWMTLPLSP